MLPGNKIVIPKQMLLARMQKELNIREREREEKDKLDFVKVTIFCLLKVMLNKV